MGSVLSVLAKGGSMWCVALFLVGVIVGIFIHKIYFLGGQAGKNVSVQDIESKIVRYLEKIESEGPNAVEKYDVIQTLNTYYGLLYLYPNLNYNTDAILAAAALDIGLRGVLFMPASVVSIVEDSPCGELIKAAIFAKLGNADMARERMQRALDCYILGRDALIKYCESRGVKVSGAD